jgi:hypothetical protein
VREFVNAKGQHVYCNMPKDYCKELAAKRLI